MSENSNILGNGNRIVTPRDIRRQEYEELKKLFGFDITFDDILSSSRSRWQSLVRQAFMWAQVHAKENGSRGFADIARMYGRNDRSNVTKAMFRIRDRAVQSKNPLFDELLELLLETSLFVVNKEVVPVALAQRIRVFMSLHDPEDIMLAHYAERRSGRMIEDEQRALKMIESGADDAAICKDLQVKQGTLRKYKNNLYKQGLLVRSDEAKNDQDKEKKRKGPVFRGFDENGNRLLALNVVDRLIFEMILDGKKAPAIREELERQGIEKSDDAVIGQAHRMFGGMKRVSRNRIVEPKTRDGEWIYKKPPK